MKEIAIYVEGGGDTAQQKAELRNGFDQLLDKPKRAARAKRLRWKLVPSGGRNDACESFLNAFNQAGAETLCVLLVDSEEGLPPESSVGTTETPDESKDRERNNAIARREHLIKRDGWELSHVPSEQIHLMVRTMEAWIVADPDQMALVYGKDFHPNQLPVRLNLEDEPKLDLNSKLARATKDTARGEYSEENHSKIKHASKLLEKIRPEYVSARCSRFATFTRWLERKIAEG